MINKEIKRILVLKKEIISYRCFKITKAIFQALQLFCPLINQILGVSFSTPKSGYRSQKRPILRPTLLRCYD